MNDESARHRRRLRSLRVEAEKRVAGHARSFDDIVDAAVDVATDDEHDPEGHTIAWERQQTAALRDEAEAMLAHIGEAEARLDAGTYGVCITCGRTIGPNRLHALPATATCVACAS